MEALLKKLNEKMSEMEREDDPVFDEDSLHVPCPKCSSDYYIAYMNNSFKRSPEATDFFGRVYCKNCCPTFKQTLHNQPLSKDKVQTIHVICPSFQKTGSHDWNVKTQPIDDLDIIVINHDYCQSCYLELVLYVENARSHETSYKKGEIKEQKVTNDRIDDEHGAVLSYEELEMESDTEPHEEILEVNKHAFGEHSMDRSELLYVTYRGRVFSFAWNQRGYPDMISWVIGKEKYNSQIRHLIQSKSLTPVWEKTYFNLPVSIQEGLRKKIEEHSQGNLDSIAEKGPLLIKFTP
jgi:hypothetical protein